MRLGVDIGGTKTDAVVVDDDGRVLHRHVCLSGSGAAAVLANVTDAVDQVCAQAGISPNALESIGVGAPGSVVDGVVTYAQNLDIARLDLAQELEKAWGVRPTVDNDVNAAAVGAWVTAGGGKDSIALLNLGTGLAAGVILDGRLWRGARGSVGEIGMISFDPAGPEGPDGLRGGLETCASGSGIAWQAGGEPAESVLARADNDADAAQIRDRFFEAVATAVRVLILTFDVEEVLVGGGLTRMGPTLMEGARRVMRDWERRSDFMRSLDLTARTRVLDPDVPLAAIGAAMRGAGRG
ncbi:ROK family protein [Demequina sp. TTPB684]|uniref:ROK family protein n=1 Tax=unclassified Demequina TaxID=2620311 RepID=UPI001CF5272E|nr:ROK family protein [Demequina sp. TMPB413]MCB2411717.1 ROK family protein [Demequina sp. TTPB684]UPU88490.1 ROK family protein [Demequina sp. TMPB413]